VKGGLPSTKSDRPIIILGCPRSGTTLLSTMLHSHPRIAMPPETRFLYTVYANRARYGDLSNAKNRRKLAVAITGPKTQFDDLRIDRDTVIERIVAGPPTLGSAFAAVWEEFAEKRGKPRWGEKRPSYYMWTSTLIRLFPDVQFVALIRDPRSCVASLMAARWWKGGFPRALTAWITSDWYLRRFARKAEPGRYFQLRYEDLVRQPREQLGPVCAFLEEDFDEAMLDHTDAAADIVPTRATHHSLTHGEVDPSRIEAWRSALTPEQIGLVELVCRRAMKRHGYEPSGLGTRPPRALVFEFLQALWRSQSERPMQLLRDAAQRRRDPVPLAAVKRPPDDPAALDTGTKSG
jgi:hypothetical protein